MNSQDIVNLSEVYQSLYEGKTPVSRSTDMRYPKKTGEEKANRRADVLSNSPDAKKRRQANTIRNRIKTVVDRDNAEARSDAFKTMHGKEVRKRIEIAKQLNNSVDLYDIVIEHLINEGFVSTVEDAQVIMANMSEEWRNDIMEQLPMGTRVPVRPNTPPPAPRAQINSIQAMRQRSLERQQAQQQSNVASRPTSRPAPVQSQVNDLQAMRQRSLQRQQAQQQNTTV